MKVNTIFFLILTISLPYFLMSCDANIDDLVELEVVEEVQPSPTQLNESMSVLIINKTKDTAIIIFSASCMYSYPCYKEGNNYIVLYDTLEDCTYYTGLKDNFGLKLDDYPKIGDPFIKLKIDGSYSLNTYLFPKWTDSINTRNAIFSTKYAFPDYKLKPNSK